VVIGSRAGPTALVVARSQDFGDGVDTGHPVAPNTAVLRLVGEKRCLLCGLAADIGVMSAYLTFRNSTKRMRYLADFGRLIGES
jgi:hypothetical protein